MQLGPDALALGVHRNKGLGLPHADVAAVLQHGYGLQVHRSTICRAVDRVARKGQPTWKALRQAARRSLVNGIDETGWRVDAQLRWLWAVVSESVTFCDILPGRGFKQAASILGKNYDGWLTHEGWKIYYQFLKASKLQRAFDGALPKDGGGGHSRGSALAAARPSAAGARLGVARSLSEERNFSAWAVDGHRTAGSPAGPVVLP